MKKGRTNPWVSDLRVNASASLVEHNQFAQGTEEVSDPYRIPTEDFSGNLSWIVA
jgi:hypothetical protein